MAIHTNISIYAGASGKERQLSGKFGAVAISGNKQTKKNEDVPTLKLNGQIDKVEQRKALAKKQAYKIVRDALANELKMDQSVQEIKDHADRLREDMDKAQNEISRINAEKEEWRKESGVEMDSEEQKDLELLEKRAAYDRGDLSKALNKEEMERVAELDKRGYTDYQKKALAMENGKAPYEDTINKAEQGIIADNAAIRGARLERLKKDFIRKAQQEKDDALAAASEEVIGMLVDEAKERMDEKSEEVQEKAEEKAKETEAQQEKLDAAKEKREEMEALANPKEAAKEYTVDTQTEPLSGDTVTEAMVQLDTQKADYQREIEEMMKKMKLLAEDVKGIKVDGEY